MDRVRIILAGFIFVNLFTYSASVLSFKTSLQGTVFESTTTRTNIVCVDCVDDAGKPVTVRKTSITNQFQCGNCFDVYTGIDASSASNWCVFYLPSQGKLNYTLAQEYRMSLTCTNDVDPAISTDVLIKVATNEPPRIDNAQQMCPTPIKADFTNAGDTVFNTLKTTISDPDGDTLFCSMTTIPPSSNFEIDPITCDIRAKKNLEMECNPSITFLVSVNDGTNPNVGPIAVTCAITGFLKSPLDPKLNRTISVREDHPNGTSMYSLDPPTISPAVVYSIVSVTPPQAHKLFSISNGRSSITLNEELDYENPFFADIYLNISADNGNCDLVYQYLNVRPIEVNEPPVLNPKVYYQQVNEESIYVNPGYLCEDEDRGDKCQFRIVGGNDEGIFQINRDTGEITARYNIDNNVRELNRTLLIEAVDLQGLTDNVTVNLNIRDINDNRPYFRQDGSGLAYTVTECTGTGVLPVNFEAFDDDSDYKGNNIITFTPARSDCIQIHADGTVHLLKTLLQPESCVLTTRAVDQGEFPGPLTSQIAATVTVTSSDCPPTPTVAVDPNDNNNNNNNNGGDTTVAATTAAVGLSGNAATTNFDAIFGILGGILGAILLGTLLACCCRRCCGKKKTAPFSSDQSAANKKKKFDTIKKKKVKAKAAAAGGAAAGAAVAAPTVVQRFLRVRRKIPFLRVKKRVPVPVRTVRQLVPVPNGQVFRTPYPVAPPPYSVRTAPANSVRQVLPAPPPYRAVGTAPVRYN
ncbi:cadherin-23-like [Haliotis rufescens]|uniref:cadherin-23-like n=1 Tax=Haliotis rufescens TaxID=6454 RepID=UPI00201EF08D|nr:cadherin-23-like [Haliotis rufescens]